MTRKYYGAKRGDSRLQGAGTLGDMRLMDDNGHQIVRCGKYAHTWDGEKPLEIGDRIFVPPFFGEEEPREVKVTGFGTNYAGELKAVLALSEAKERLTVT